MSEDKRLVVGLNGSPRKGWNTGKLVSEALKGASEEGAETKSFDLYDLYFKGCASCFSCKTKTGYLNGTCAIKDELSPVLELLTRATGLVLGSPIYVWDVTACVRAFIERYCFSNLEYNKDSPSVLVKGPAVGLIYTMGVPEDVLKARGADFLFGSLRNLFKERIKAPFIEELYSCDTLQFTNYSRYHCPVFNEDHKKSFHEENFPKNLEEALKIGRKLGKAKEVPKYRKDL
jgi:multimeric flavodoxin WrbA